MNDTLEGNTLLLRFSVVISYSEKFFFFRLKLRERMKNFSEYIYFVIHALLEIDSAFKFNRLLLC